MVKRYVQPERWSDIYNAAYGIVAKPFGLRYKCAYCKSEGPVSEFGAQNCATCGAPYSTTEMAK